MKLAKYLSASALTLMMGTASVNVLADVDVEDFVENASELNIAEIEAAKLALEKSSSATVKSFAQKMINDHTAANRELRSIASAKKVELEDDAALTDQAKAAILKQRDGESFDEAYANNQVAAHRKAIDFYQKASKSEDAEVRAFAVATLPKLQHHLTEAQALAKAVGASSAND